MSAAGLASPPPRLSGRLRGLVLIVLVEAALVVCWSAGFIGVRFASDHAPIFLILLWRSLVSGLVLLPFALVIVLMAIALWRGVRDDWREEYRRERALRRRMREMVEPPKG